MLLRLSGTCAPANGIYLTNQTQISNFAQYQHLENLASLVSENQALSAALGHGYIVTPDIVIARYPVSQDEVNASHAFLDDSGNATLTPFISDNHPAPVPILHASISCKWTIRSDRSQNTRTEALNLIRNRKGNFTAYRGEVTAEPLPMRIASLALGTGDIDCVYPFRAGRASASLPNRSQRGRPARNAGSHGRGQSPARHQRLAFRYCSLRRKGRLYLYFTDGSCRIASGISELIGFPLWTGHLGMDFPPDAE